LIVDSGDVPRGGRGPSTHDLSGFDEADGQAGAGLTVINNESSWVTERFADFLSAVASNSDVLFVTSAAVKMVAHVLDADVAAVLSEDRVQASFGFDHGQVPNAENFETAMKCGSLDVPRVGRCSCIASPIDSPIPGTLLVAWHRDDTFNGDEVSLLRALARSLGMALRMIQLADGERALRLVHVAENLALSETVGERQDLLERLARIQRAMSVRMPINQMLDAIVAGAAELFGDEIVGLRMLDPNDPDYLVLVAHRGLSAKHGVATARSLAHEGAGGRAFKTDSVVVINDSGHSDLGLQEFGEGGTTTAMAAPVYENGQPVGSIVVASLIPGRSYSTAEQEVLRTFVEHASVCLTGAKSGATMEHQAFHDPLTELPNRALFIDRLGQALRRSRREPGPQVAVLLIDLDRFKFVNDSLGHAAGDLLLTQVAERLLGAIRDVDTAARLGGDEFAVLVEECAGTRAASALAERLLEALRPAFSVGGKDVSIAATIGIAVASLGQEEASEMLRNADLAMYQAKVSGSGCSRVFEPSMHTAVMKRLDLESEMRRGIETGEFVLYFQPQFELRSGRTVGVEALLRWQHPTLGLIYPADFIEIAEETGLIVPIGGRVLESAVKMSQLLQGFAPGPDPFTMSVNLSVRQVQQPDLAYEVDQVLKAASIDPASLTLEMTETVLMEDTEVTLEQLTRLRSLGVRLAIDDFGTGYSSLGYLRRFPIDVLKIDQSFINGVGQSAQGSALTTAIMALAQTLDLETVAEGIERPEQLEDLVRMNCLLGQGFLLSPALPAAQLSAFLKRQERKSSVARYSEIKRR
jgi:diguanylate cyclase (GGDEF)-like protein